MENDEQLPTDTPHDDEGAERTADDVGTPTERPLGYWLRLVDALITREFARTLENEGVGRRDWMLLNVLSGTIEVPGLAERLARRGKHLRRLEERGWVAPAGDGTWSLTDEGRAAQERLTALVSGIREKVAGAVSPEEFATMTASLEAIARELGGDETSWPGRGFGFGGRGFGRGFGKGFGGDRGFGPDFRSHEPGYGPRFGPAGRGFGPGRGPWQDFGPDAEDADAPRRPQPMDGPNLHRGFGPGGDPRHPHPHGHGNGHGYRYMRDADPERADHGGHGHDGHGCEPHGEHPQHRGHGKARRAAEHGYERGFAAGFGAGRRPEPNDPAV
ncbi:MAG: hypothetical protein J0J05_08685 [Microbacterium sp.]|uniref:MarR family winged helix-turn-helix transcriptional regulator n=1 Tax=Microbacterium sp. TaxID=51671 RepID=UPI001ACC9E26|nr:hypothetical protein [Microbacterium sp.]MBN9154045.1 hypothetical protein [Microbacterium sp.]